MNQPFGFFDKAVSLASRRKRAAASWEEWREANYEVRRCKRRRGAWLRDKEVQWWDDKARLAQDQADKGDAFGVFATFRELRLRGSSAQMGEVQPADAQRERDAWAEHFRKIGEGAGEVKDPVWANVPFYSPMDVVWGDAPVPNELHAALRQVSLGRAAGGDGVTAELREWLPLGYDGHLGLHQFGFRKGKRVDDALQITRRLVEVVATNAGDHEGVELSFHDIEKAYPRVCRKCSLGFAFEMGL